MGKRSRLEVRRNKLLEEIQAVEEEWSTVSGKQRLLKERELKQLEDKLQIIESELRRFSQHDEVMIENKTRDSSTSFATPRFTKSIYYVILFGVLIMVGAIILALLVSRDPEENSDIEETASSPTVTLTVQVGNSIISSEAPTLTMEPSSTPSSTPSSSLTAVVTMNPEANASIPSDDIRATGEARRSASLTAEALQQGE